nr:hypothetical protein GCM10020093_048750 [Planobispora longispora]
MTWEARPYQVGDVDGAWLVQACTDDRAVNTAIAAEAEAKRIWCVRADDRDASAAWTPASGRVGEIGVAISAGGDPGGRPGSGTPWWRPCATARSRPGATAPSPSASPSSGAAPATPG